MKNLVEKPWGWYTVLHEGYCNKVKKIVVLRNHRLSLQSHEHRDEHWILVEGSVLLEKWLTEGDYKKGLKSIREILKVGDFANIRKGELHRVTAVDSNAAFIEVQIGNYLEEDDIKRYEDDYDRIDVHKEN